MVALLLVELLEPRALMAAPSGFDSRGLGGGGAFFAPSFSPHNASEIFVASDMSGVYHSTSLGTSWQVEDFRQLQGGRSASIQFTSDPKLLFTVDSGGDSGRPAKSID